MFRKLVANLSFSPALINEVGFYAGRLRKEEATRKLAFIFMILALIVQSLAVFSPPESANAASEQDILRGGISSKADLLNRYTANDSSFKDILTAAGITSQEIGAVESSAVQSKDNTLVMGRLPRFGSEGGETAFSYTRSDTGQTSTAYISPLRLWDTTDVAQQFGTSYDAWTGRSEKLGWFAILKNCGNLVTKTLPQGATKSTISVKQELSATNLSQGNVPAENVIAAPSDRISYTVRATNTSTSKQLAPIAITLDDVLEYSTLLDNGGGSVDAQSPHLLSWPPATLMPGQTEERTFVVQILDPVPASPHGKSNGMSYDCVLTSAYGTSTNIRVHCPAEKDIEMIISLLPTIGITGNLIFAAAVASLVIFFYLRTRQLKEEIRLIRHNLNEGTL
jgi:hypothetical protein